MRTYDITPEITESLAVFPGDTPFQREVLLGFDRGDALALSAIRSTVHLGAHVDAPNHYHRDGHGIASRSLDYYLGPCQVVSVKLARGERIRPEHLGATKIETPRVLFKTGSYPNPNQWNVDFCSLSAELVDFLAARGVRLVGIDTPSIDPAEDKVLESHQAIYRHDLAVLEGIVLNDVPDGVYVLVALPLKIRDADASPVRAILLDQKEVSSWNPKRQS